MFSLLNRSVQPTETTNYTYSQQVSSPLLTQAENILSSLAQN
jgi:hypothetical protein